MHLSPLFIVQVCAYSKFSAAEDRNFTAVCPICDLTLSAICASLIEL